MLSKKIKKAIALSMALTISGGFAQSSSMLTAAYGEETNGQEAKETLEDSFTEADESLKEKLNSELNNQSTQADAQTILNNFEYATSGVAVNVTSGAAVKITANNITDYKNDADSCSFKASLEGYEKNGESYELKGTKEFTYSKTKETPILTTMAYSSPAGSGEWVSNEPLTIDDVDGVTITKGDQIVKFKLLDAEDKTVSVSGNGITASNVELSIPKTITCGGTEYKVTQISDSAFYNCNQLANVTIPDGVEIIGLQAFYGCSKITSLTLPKEINSIGNSAFWGCTSLQNTNYPKILGTTGTDIFNGCNKLESVNVEDGVKSIGNYAFKDCTGLTSLTLPVGLESIGNNAFENCTALNLKLPEGITAIGESAFYNCGLTSVTIPGSVSTISDSAFQGCTKMQSVTLEKGVKSIKNNAFRGCTALASVNLPEGLTGIGEYAFYKCGLTSIILPETLTSIGADAFNQCKIKSVTIPEGVTTFGNNAFYNLDYMNLPDDLDVSAVSSGKFVIPINTKMLLVSTKIMEDLKNTGFQDTCTYKILGLKLITEFKTISGYKGSMSYDDVLEPVGSAADVKVEIISGNDDDIAKAAYDKAKNKVTITATGKGNGTVKVKITAQETVNKQTYDFYKIRQVNISKNVDRSSLIDKYNEANKLSKDNYTEVSFSALKEPVSNAQIVINDGSTAIKEDIDNAYNALNNAINNLVDISEIKKLYEAKKDIAKGNYTDETYNSFKTALKDAETIINKTDASKSEVNSALKELKEATGKLLGTDKTSLISLYNKYAAMKQGEYTDDSFNNFTAALNNAKSAIDNVNVAQSEITAAEKKLQDAVSTLKVKSSSSGGSSSGSGSSGGSSSSGGSGSSSSGSSSGSSSASEAKPVITVDGEKIKEVTLSKDTYGSSVIGNTLAPLGLNLSELNLLYEINSDKFKGNVAKLSKTTKNADGTNSETHYVYIKCEEGEKFKADISNLNKDVPAYVYKIDNNGSVSLVETLDSNTVKNNGYNVELNSEQGSTYVISEEKINTASSVTTGWNLIDGKWHEVLADGNYVKGWYKDADEKWYMLDKTTGVMVTGWFKDKDEKWYYLKESGAMATGWVKDIDGKWYYLDGNGAMAKNTSVNGYYLGEDGAWIKQ